MRAERVQPIGHRLGLVHQLIVRDHARHHAQLELSLLAETMDAEAAFKLGVATRVVPHDQLMDEARSMADRLNSFSPHALRLGMEAFRVSTGMQDGTASSYMNALRVMFYHSQDLKEGATAFLEKRPPQWRGR